LKNNGSLKTRFESELKTLADDDSEAIDASAKHNDT
jgi:hypothetical protein